MKKSLIFTAILISFVGVALATETQLKIPPETDYFSGFYLGGTFGLHQMNVNSSSSITTPFDLTGGGLLPSADALINSSGGGNSFAGFSGIQGGFGKVFSHQVYLGVSGFGDFGNQSVSQTSSSTSTTAQRR